MLCVYTTVKNLTCLSMHTQAWHAHKCTRARTHTHTHKHHRALIAGGGAPEIEVSQQLMAYSQSLTGMEAYCVRGFAEAMEIIPYTLAENAGLNPIAVVTELRNRHAKGEKNTGINVRKVCTAVLQAHLQYGHVHIFLCVCVCA